MMIRFKELNADSITKKLSAVINLIDDFSGDRPNGRIEVILEDVNAKPVKNPGGYYVFTGLFPGVYKLMVQTDNYLPFCGDLIVPESIIIKPLFLNVRLVPSVNYPFSWGSTLLRGAVSDKNGKAVNGALIKANILPKGNSSVKLGEVNSIDGDVMEVKLNSTLNAIDRFNILKIGTSEGKMETCRVKEIIKKEGKIEKVLLTEPLKDSHAGQSVYLTAIDIIETLSDEKGEFVVCFRNIGENTLHIDLETSFSIWSFTNLVDGIEQGSIRVTEGSTTFVRVMEKSH